METWMAMPDATPRLAHQRYDARELLGRGAQGSVVRVVDREAPERPLCAKLWHAGVFEAEPLKGEFALLARLRIEGLVRAHDLGFDAKSGAPFLVEDFVGGPDAAAWMEGRTGATGATRLARLVSEVATTLARLHDAGFVHGDLKPAHVRIDPPSGRPTLLDLGSAVGRARAGDARGFTRAFAAPELRAGAAPTVASDLYGLGALAWAAAAGRAPERPRTGLRRLAPWAPPSVTDVIEALLEEHPRDRPADARAVLGALGARGAPIALPPVPIGRELDVEALARPPWPAVRYLVGPSGVGKSHLAREVVVRALCAGRAARLVSFSSDGASALVARLVAFFRGSEEAWPLATPLATGAPLLLVLDDLHLAPEGLAAALDAYRCRIDAGLPPAPGLAVLATARLAPDGAPAWPLGPLDAASFRALCRALGVAEARIAASATASERLPGWLVAEAGCVPLTRDTALERTRSLSRPAVELLAAIALAGGGVSEALCAALVGPGARPGATPAPLAELLGAALVTRRADAAGVAYRIEGGRAADLGAALASFELADRLADALCADAASPAAALLAVADAPTPPSRRLELCERAAAAARAEGLRAEEIRALGTLVADAHARTGDRLRRLERLGRDAGTTLYPQVLDWLDEAAEGDPELRPLALRRRAEKLAREGNATAARACAADAVAAARTLRSAVHEGLARATLGAVALYRADWAEADDALREARARLAAVELDDPEELARLDHNLGVVALYRGRRDEAVLAFERSLAAKRRLGDRAGMRSCLLNLGIALGKTGEYDQAARALGEALALARSLGQSAGRGWCMAALADLALERGDAAESERWMGEAEALGDALPAPVQADLCLLRAQIALREGDGARALAAVGALDPALREADALIDGRALATEASARLATLPADPRGAARLAVRALRRAREAGLADVHAPALDALRAARSRRATPRIAEPGYAPAMPAAGAPTDDDAWRWLGEVAGGADADAAALDLARLIVRRCRAERAFVALVDAAGAVVEAAGADLDGLPVAEARGRIDAELVRTALAGAQPVYHRDVPTAAGRGSRAAAAGPEAAAGRALVVVEHRFHAGHFDGVSADDLTRWATLAAVCARLRGDAAPSRPERRPDALPSPGGELSGASTELPLQAPRRAFPRIVGQSAALGRALARLDAAIDGELPVLIVGETGVGKELFARALHEHGPRAARAFVAVNCGAIPDALFEAELYGHARGSFTGAERARPGLLAHAEGGTLLLDEVGELPLLRQAALLRALESRRYRAVGADDERPFDVRIVAATNRDLSRAVADGSFRQDLLYRLNAVEIRVPPLRERIEDVALLVRAFLERTGAALTIAPRAMAALVSYGWPGNVREIEHLVQRLTALGAERIELEHLPRAIRTAVPSGARERRRARREPSGDPRGQVQAALARTGGNITRAAADLGLTRQGLKKRMTRLGMRPAKLREEE
jgi:DNA-binding NtrC family response regulator/tetratricopeptide (TPR) repeat protein